MIEEWLFLQSAYELFLRDVELQEVKNGLGLYSSSSCQMEDTRAIELDEQAMIT
jgi:hypothetical protein